MNMDNMITITDKPYLLHNIFITTPNSRQIKLKESLLR